jgi:hypothetical protein
MPSYQVRAFFHADETKTVTARANRPDVESLPVVGDDELDMLPQPAESHVESSRVAMHNPVSQRFLRDPEETQREVGRDQFEIAHRLEVHVHAVAIFNFDTVGPQRGDSTKELQRGRVQVMGKAPDLPDHLLEP